MPITELKIFKYECENCLHDWTMINPGKDWRSLEDAGYFCGTFRFRNAPCSVGKNTLIDQTTCSYSR